MIGKGTDDDQLPRIIMQEIDPQQILRVVADAEVIIQIPVGILALRVFPIPDLVLGGGEFDRYLAYGFTSNGLPYFSPQRVSAISFGSCLYRCSQ